MYCPKCATRLAETATRCHACDLDVQPITQLLHQEPHSAARFSGQRLTEARVARWKHQRRSWGTLLVMCSLLVGCLIPIAVGIFNNSEALGSIVTVLAGLAGLLLIVGSMILLAADGVILATEDVPPLPQDDDRAATERVPHTGQTKFLDVNTTVSGTRYEEPAAYSQNR